jgi:hypothetical protein
VTRPAAAAPEIRVTRGEGARRRSRRSRGQAVPVEEVADISRTPVTWPQCGGRIPSQLYASSGAKSAVRWGVRARIAQMTQSHLFLASRIYFRKSQQRGRRVSVGSSWKERQTNKEATV